LEQQSTIQNGTLFVGTDADIKEKAQLINIILIAGRDFKTSSEAELKGQFLCGNRMEIGGNSICHYFTLLCASPFFSRPGMNTTTEPGLFLIDNTRLNGVALYSSPDNSDQPRLFVDNNTVVQGYLYCSGQTEFRGTLFGSLYTFGVLFRYGTTQHQSSIKDGRIDITRLQDGFYIPLLFGKTKEILFHENK